MRTVLANLSLIALAGLFVTGSLLAEPSQEGSFLGFSAGRWAVFLVNLFVLTGVLFAVYKVLTDQAKKLETWLASERHLFRLFFLAIILFGFSFPAGMGRVSAIRYFAYFGRIQPSLLWLAFASELVCLTLLIVLRKPILRWFRQFFPEPSTQGTIELSTLQG